MRALKRRFVTMFLQKAAPCAGLEPATDGLKVQHSTD